MGPRPALGSYQRDVRAAQDPEPHPRREGEPVRFLLLPGSAENPYYGPMGAKATVKKKIVTKGTRQDHEGISVKYRDPGELKPYARNSKAHPPDQVARIAAQIQAFGFDVPIVVDRDGVIVKGHGRREAALSLGLKSVPVIVTDLPPEKAMAARIGDNKSAESPWLSDVLHQEFQHLTELGFDLTQMTGFHEEEWKTIVNGWHSDLSPVDKAGTNLEGIMSFIKIACPPELKDTLRGFLEEKITERGFQGVTVG